MAAIRKPSAAFLALTTSALALPVYAPMVAAATAPTEPQTDYRYSYYREDDLPSTKLSAGSATRYSIDSHQFEFVLPVSDKFAMSAEAVYETMSGASPWYSLPSNGPGSPALQVMSGATIDDQRVALDVHGHLYQSATDQTFTLGFSREKDYLSVSGGVESAWNFNEQRSTLSGGLGYSRDEITPTDGATTRYPTRIGRGHKDAINAVIGFSQVLTEQTVAQATLNYGYSKGFLSDPYKMVSITGQALTADTRPDRRSQGSLNLRLRQFIPAVSAAIHADYRYFADDWGVVAHTADVAWVQRIPEDYLLTLGLRYYSQGMADFYAPYFDAPRADGLYSSDYRLSPYGALAYRMGLDKDWQRWHFAASAEWYRSSADYALGSVSASSASPGLVDFSMVSVAVGYRF